MSMRKNFTLALVVGFVALFGAGAKPVFAASGSCNTANCTTPGVDLNFEVVIPSLVRLRIGDATAVNTLSFAPTADQVGTATPIAATGGDGIVANGVTVNVLANGGATSVQVDTSVTGGGQGIDCQASSGSCQNGSDFIAWDQITVAGSGCSVNPPALSNAGGTFATYNANLNGIVNEVCEWRYTYDNTLMKPDGIYSGTVTYTATVTP
jgi:hypothetical protein